MSTQATYRSLTITAGNGKATMSQEDGHYRYVYNVTVRSDGTGAVVRFTFTDSINNYDQGMRGLGPRDLLQAFGCFASDAATGRQSFEDFCGDFGYDTDSRTAERTWKACQKAAADFRRLWVSDVDPSEVDAELNR